MKDKPQSAKSSGAETVIPLPQAFEDARGRIQTLVDGGIQSVQVITSKANTVRANHFHKTDSHYMYVVSGSMKYYHRPAGDRSSPEMVLVRPGEMVFTPPMVEHAVEFPEETVFLNLTGKTREQKSYEDDLVRVEVVKPGDHAA
jgi:mannose-6-phosphate isomerase-like protein (cupin superfamily)